MNKEQIEAWVLGLIQYFIKPFLSSLMILIIIHFYQEDNLKIAFLMGWLVFFLNASSEYHREVQPFKEQTTKEEG